MWCAQGSQMIAELALLLVEFIWVYRCALIAKGVQ